MKYEEHKKGGKEKYFYQPLYSIQRGHAFKFMCFLNSVSSQRHTLIYL